MIKKTIILVLIALLILNTLFWINLLVQRISKSRPFRNLITGKIDTIEYTYSERLEKALSNWEVSKGPMIILIITNAVLVAIYFMIIPFYKKG